MCSDNATVVGDRDMLSSTLAPFSGHPFLDRLHHRQQPSFTSPPEPPLDQVSVALARVGNRHPAPGSWASCHLTSRIPYTRPHPRSRFASLRKPTKTWPGGLDACNLCSLSLPRRFARPHFQELHIRTQPIPKAGDVQWRCAVGSYVLSTWSHR